MDQAARFLQHRVHEELVWLRLHVDPQATEADALDYLRAQCGFHNGRCQYAPSDYCRLDCPYRPEDL